PAGEEEIFSKEEFIDIFDENRLSKSPALFDKQKLEWMNNQYMKKLDQERLVSISAPHLVKAGKISENWKQENEEWVNSLISLYQEKMSFGAQIVELSELFFTEEITVDEEAKEVLAEEQVPEVLSAFLQEIDALAEFKADEIK